MADESHRQPINDSDGSPSYQQIPVENAPPSHQTRRGLKRSSMVGIGSFVIFLTGGMNIALSMGFSDWGFPNNLLTTHLSVSWFVGAMIGAICGAIGSNLLPKKLIMLASAVLVVVSGLLLMAVPTNVDGLTGAGYLNGMANGFIFVPTLVLVGECAPENSRGKLCALYEAVGISAGIAIQLFVFSLSVRADALASSTMSTRMSGGLFILSGCLALALAYFCAIESPVLYLLHDEERRALYTEELLQRSFMDTNRESSEQFNLYRAQEVLEEHRNYIAMNRELTLRESITTGLPALLKLCLYRGLTALSFSAVTCAAFFMISLVSTLSIDAWSFAVFGLLRFVSVLVAAMLMEYVGRKKPMLFGLALHGLTSIALAALFANLNKFHTSAGINIIMGLFFLCQLSVGFANNASTIYLSEAFPLTVKPYFIAVAYMVEMLVYIIIFICKYNEDSFQTYFCAVGILTLLFTMYAYRFLPETKNTTLREAQVKFS